MYSSQIGRVCIGILMLIGILDLPYGYYSFLRWAVFLCMIFIVVVDSSKGFGNLTIPHVIIGLLFNPLFPVFLDKSY